MLKIHSLQSLGTLDGPGVRFVVFLQGCPLRCKCCHNPDTWDIFGGKEMPIEDIFSKVKRYKEYFKQNGGITASGGEPLLQAAELEALFRLCKNEGINTCLDTSGCLMNSDIEQLLGVTDRVLLDIKYTNENDYIENVGCSYKSVIDFLSRLNALSIPVTIRQVIIPTVNDNEENILALKALKEKYPCIDSFELLPFKKLCQTKYDALAIPFPFGDIPEPTKEKMQELNSLL